MTFCVAFRAAFFRGQKGVVSDVTNPFVLFSASITLLIKRMLLNKDACFALAKGSSVFGL
jgi:hypothetical protein